MRQLQAIAIITARGGSKRIPRKNIKPFVGQPIIKYAIETALKSGCFNEVMVSTDDKEIAEVAKRCGAKVPFMRSKETANDYAGVPDVLLEVLERYAKRGMSFEYCCGIFPTAVFTTPSILKESFELLKHKKGQSVVPVVKFSFPIQRAFRIKDGILRMYRPKLFWSRSQDLEPSYHDAGQFYWLRVASFKKQKTLFAKVNLPYFLPETKVQDIDNEEDWKLAEIKYKLL